MRLQSRIPKLNAILLGIYLLAVWLAFVFLYGRENRIAVYLTPLIVILVAVLVPRLLDWIGRIHLPVPSACSVKEKAAIFGICFLATAAVLLIWRLSCWPGGFAPDAGNQLHQAMTGKYNDWHPVWHTLLFFTLPLRLTGSTLSIYFFQDLVFCISVSYAVTVIRLLGGRLFAFLSWCCILLNPFVCYVAMFPLKDTPFSLACLVSAVLSVQMWCTRGESGKSWLRCAILGVSLANAALFRHNGILFSGFLLFSLIFTMKKNWWRTALVFTILFVFVRLPLYRALDVQAADESVSEVTCVPMAMIGNAVLETPELLDAETLELAYAVAPREDWETYYERGEYNSLKWFHANPQALEDAGLKKVLLLTWRTVRNSPDAALKSLVDATDLVYGLHASSTAAPYFPPYFTGDSAGMVRHAWGPASSVISRYARLCRAKPLCYLFTTGLSIVVMLTFLLGRCNFGNREDRQRILIALSIFCYDFGTMLLVGGVDYLRGMAATFFVCPAYVLLMLYRRVPEAENQGIRNRQGESAV